MESISLKLIFRSWWRNKTFAVISLLSLAAGITCTNLLISYVIYESRIEAHNPNKSHIIYMAQDSPLTSGEKVSFIKGPIPVQLKDQYPEVEDYLRLNIENAASITIGEKRFDPISIVRADPSSLFPLQGSGRRYKQGINPTKRNCVDRIPSEDILRERGSYR